MLRNPEFWVLVSFIIFFVLFGRRLWRALADMLDARAATVRASLAEAARLRAEAEQMLREAEAAKQAALAEARDMIAHSNEEAKRVAEAARAEAEAAAKRREQMALDRIAAAEKAAVDEVRQAAATLATTAAQTVIAEGLSAEEDGEIIDRAISGLPRALRAA